MKRYFLIAAALIVTTIAIMYYRHSIIPPERPVSVPTTSVPCQFGFALRWIELSGSSAYESAISVFDAQGKLVGSQRVILAKEPTIQNTTNSRGYEPYPIDTEGKFEFPKGVVLRGSGLGSSNNLVVQVDEDHSFVPYWWFK